MPEPTSPWADSADLVSPDGRYRAVIADAQEIRMGAPTSGTLEIRENHEGGRVLRRLDGSNPSCVWSDRSDALAVPRWTDGLMQRLLIVPVATRAIRSIPGEYRVLELHAFDAGVVSGVDSPIHMPRAVRVSVDDGAPHSQAETGAPDESSEFT